MPNGQRQGGTGCQGGREPVLLGPPRVTVPPVRVTHRAQPLRRYGGKGLQGAAPRFANHLEAVQSPHRCEHMGGVRPLPTPRLHELVVAAPCEQGLEEQILRRPSDEAGAKFTENRGIKPRIRPLQASDVCPIDAATDGMGRVAVGKPLREWPDGHQCQEPRGARGLSVAREERSKRLICQQTIQSSATRRYRLPLGKAARVARAVSGGMGSIGIRRRMGHLHVYMRNRHDAEASYQCVQDFASSIKSDEEPTSVTPVRT